MDLPQAGRVASGRQRLAEHLPAEHTVAPNVAALAAEDVVFDALELEQLQEIREDWCHFSLPASDRSSPRRRAVSRLGVRRPRVALDSKGLWLQAQQDDVVRG